MQKDLEQVLEWFNSPNGQAGSFLTPDGLLLMDEIQDALSTHALHDASCLSRNLFHISTRDRKEVGEILLRTALYAVLLEEEPYLQFAKEQVQYAAESFINIDTHSRAFALWFVGFVCWQLPIYRIEAVRYWEHCRHLLYGLSFAHNAQYQGWYQEKFFIIVSALFQTRMFKEYYPLTAVDYPIIRPHPQPAAQPGASAPPPPSPKPRKHKSPNVNIRIRTIPLFQYVPAGGWGVVEPDEVGRVKVEVEQMEIENVPHRIMGLQGQQQVRFNDGATYAVVRIKGTSMNRRDIQDGDYVLIRLQSDAVNGDIVLAERIGIDSEATLKRLYRQGNIIELHPESDDPENKVLPVDKRDHLRILGVAIAVLKPIPPEDETATP